MNIEDLVMTIVTEKLSKTSIYTTETQFDKLGLDSMDIMAIALKVEQQCDVTFEDNQILKFSCVQDIVDNIRAQNENNIYISEK